MCLESGDHRNAVTPPLESLSASDSPPKDGITYNWARGRSLPAAAEDEPVPGLRDPRNATDCPSGDHSAERSSFPLVNLRGFAKPAIAGPAGAIQISFRPWSSFKSG